MLLQIVGYVPWRRRIWRWNTWRGFCPETRFGRYQPFVFIVGRRFPRTPEEDSGGGGDAHEPKRIIII